MKNKEVLINRNYLSDAPYADTLHYAVKSAKDRFDARVFGRPGLQEDRGQEQSTLIALPKTRLTRALQPGDVLLVRAYGSGKAYEAVLTTGRTMTRAEALEAGFYASAGATGLFVELAGVYPPGSRTIRRIADENGFLLYDCLLLRPAAPRLFHPGLAETTPPANAPAPVPPAPPPVASIYLPPAPNVYQPSANGAIFRCPPAPVQIPTATLFPARPADADQTIDQVLAFMGLTPAEIRRFRQRRGFDSLRPIAQRFGDAFSELLIRLRYPTEWLKQPRENHAIRGIHQEEKLGPRVLLTIPGHFRELARRTNDTAEAFGLENIGWLMMETIRNQMDIDTGHRWWLPPAPDFVTKFPNALPRFSAQLNDLIIELGLTDAGVDQTQYAAKQTAWEAGLPGQFWRAETGQNLTLPPGLPFYPELATIPAAVNVSAEKAQILAAWTTRVQEVDRLHPLTPGMTPAQEQAMMRRRIAALTDRDTPNPPAIRNLFDRASFGGVQLAYNFPQLEGAVAVVVRNHARVLTILVPVVEAVFRTIRELGWNDLLFHTAGSQVFRGKVQGGGTLEQRHRTALRISDHAYGLALDLNEIENPLNEHASMHPRLVALFEAFGFNWGGCFTSNPDPHHFEYAGNPYVAPPPATPAQPVTATPPTAPPTQTPAVRPAEAVEPNALPCPAGSRKITTATSFGAVTSCQKPDGTPHGPYVEIWKNNKKKVEGQYENGRLTGQWRSWHENGQPQVETAYAGGVQEGAYKKWFENGQVCQEGHYRKGKTDGLWVFYDAEGQKREQGSFAGGLKTGAWQQWHGNGELASKSSYDNGSPTGTWTSWHYNGQKSEEGRVEGIMTRTVGLRTWNTPKRVDQWAFWYPNGRQYQNGNYIDGYKEGDWNYWNPAGVLARTTTYTRGTPADKEKPRIV